MFIKYWCNFSPELFLLYKYIANTLNINDITKKYCIIIKCDLSNVLDFKIRFILKGVVVNDIKYCSNKS